LQRAPYDVVEFYGAEAWLAILLLRWRYGKKYLLVCHSNGLEVHVNQVMATYRDLWPTPRRWYQLDQSAVFQWAFRAVDGLIVLSAYDRDFALTHQYQDPDHVVTVCCGLPDVYRDRAVTLARPPVIGYCGSWIPRKGLAVLVPDVSRILREFPEARFQLIGVGDSFPVGDIFPADVLHQIEVIPFVSEKSVLAALYEAIAIVLMPSWYESFGLVAAEAMACGCAVIATDVGIITHLPDQTAVWKLPTARSPHLYTAMQHLLQDEPRRRALAQAGYQAAQQWTWEVAIAQIETAYTTWLAAVRPDTPPL
jgi:glycosyltransferase involved in cell wall biosynthesis